MDIPLLYANKDRKEILNFLRSHAFGLLISQGGDGPEASHLPYTIESTDSALFVYSHMGKVNRHRRFLDVQNNHLFIVQGVDHYISSTWYDHENVPTWNYISVHLSGQIEIQQGEDAFDNIRRLMDQMEQPGHSPRSLDRLNSDMVHREIQGLVAFRMKVNKIEAAKKLSQNRDEKNYNSIIRELEALEYDQALKMAEEMRKNHPF